MSLFIRGLTRECSKYQVTIPNDRLMYDTGDYGNYFIETVIKVRGEYGVVVTQLFRHSFEYCFHAVFRDEETIVTVMLLLLQWRIKGAVIAFENRSSTVG